MYIYIYMLDKNDLEVCIYISMSISIYIYTSFDYIHYIDSHEIIQCGVYSAAQKHVAQYKILQYSNARESTTERYSTSR